eukprot:scaffold18932_cov65-Phaeocystis_antarctica.AAC.8
MIDTPKGQSQLRESNLSRNGCIQGCIGAIGIAASVAGRLNSSLRAHISPCLIQLTAELKYLKVACIHAVDGQPLDRLLINKRARRGRQPEARGCIEGKSSRLLVKHMRTDQASELRKLHR